MRSSSTANGSGARGPNECRRQGAPRPVGTTKLGVDLGDLKGYDAVNTAEVGLETTTEMTTAGRGADASAPADQQTESAKGTAEVPSRAWQADNALTEPREDRLGRAAFARGVATGLAARTDLSSIVVGLYGPWGDGKTTVLNFIEREVGDAFVVVRFNPWLISDERELLPAFFRQVASELDVKLGGARRQVADAFRAIGAALAPVSVGAGGASARPGDALGAIGDQLAGKSLEALRRDFENALTGADKRVLILVDDLDRLDDREIRTMFRLIRLAAPFDRLSYVVACDESVVARALGHLQGSTTETGHAFLEKIVQVPLHIPPASEPTLTRLALEGMQELVDALNITYTDDQAREIGTRYRIGLAPAFRTPRSVKRYLNALRFALPLLKGEANVADVIAVEGVHVAYPTVYRALRDTPDSFLQPRPSFALGRNDDAERALARERIESFLPIDEPLRAGALALIRRLFPQVDALWSGSNVIRENSDWYAEQRMASSAYYSRYLAYALPTDEISDQEVDGMLALPNGLPDAVRAIILARGAPAVGPLTAKLDIRMARLELDSALALLEVLPSLGPLVVDREAAPLGFFASSLQERLSTTIARLIDRAPRKDRMRLARHVLETAKPLTFALDCLRAFHARRSDHEGKIFDEIELARLNREFGARVRTSLEPRMPIWKHEPRWPTLMSLAVAGSGARLIRPIVSRWLDTDAEAVDSLLTGLAGRARNLGTGDSIQQDFRTDTYAALATFARVADVRRAVRRKYGRLLVETYPPDASYVPDSTRAVVEQFVYIDTHQEKIDPPQEDT